MVRHKGRKLGREGTKGRAISSLAVDERDFGFLLSIGRRNRQREGRRGRRGSDPFSLTRRCGSEILDDTEKKVKKSLIRIQRIWNLTSARDEHVYEKKV